eukprot:CAMPEP_0202395842 /NCGR_PEP_ID=MMETSP1127-20130417/94182_1 /ASSEMBLY_ACC=CAM_ASM_000462 /TAXON_ID=3047 /ORGANISM="Dunaliella tertiolecta, Strain CCMP1320" /LENGTH=77 /DNA_ID=CAMNT_0048998563 /DNA_START=1941 /DNA_END=2170 /DNA_ORIENTATION=+
MGPGQFPFKKWSSHASAACMAASLVAANAPARQVPKGSRLRAAAASAAVVAYTASSNTMLPGLRMPTSSLELLVSWP